ncbi:HPP family protein [Falsigemmobacter intermedius]|uniref:CBS domain-containing protein n=1 Tax=Falsigemmobacter intermedius TaxID=1553448 RepID=A0A3S4XCP2_9RHOB|nr:HPP family protein [Falsigemmobacter intermedius]RWY33886.1 CBS domain-containing protein [Falsigemmobacter intermedius]
MRTLLKFPLRALGPVAAVPFWEALRSGSGALLALAAISLIALSSYATAWGFTLIAPFGASAVLLFAAVNSPLAQPWPVVIGNTASAIVAVGVCTVIPEPLMAAPLSVAGAILTMAVLRATHPPGGAVALTVALAVGQTSVPEITYIVIPVAAGSLVLVLLAVFWAWLTGRRYPMRQFRAPGPVLTADPPAVERLGLTEAELRDLLADYRQSLNVGVEDLARLIGAAELRAAGHHVTPTTAGEIMSRDLVTVRPEASLEEVAGIFRHHGFTSLPVVSESGALSGVIFQLNLIAGLSEMRYGRFSLRSTSSRKSASDIMSTVTSTVNEDAPIGLLASRLSEKGADAVLVVSQEKLSGVVTQTDLISALARELLHRRSPVTR